MSGAAITWLAFALLLALFGARAWVVETNRGRLSTAGTAQRGLTWAVAGSMVLLIGLAAANGGLTLIGLLVNGEPQTTAPADGPVANPLAPGAGAPAVPGGTPPAGGVPPAGGAPAAPGAGAPVAPANP